MNTKFVRIEVLILEKVFGFEQFWCSLCVDHGRRMVKLAQPIKGWEDNFTTKKHRLHSYVIIIHSFSPKPIHVEQVHPLFHQGCNGGTRCQCMLFQKVKVCLLRGQHCFNNVNKIATLPPSLHTYVFKPWMNQHLHWYVP